MSKFHVSPRTGNPTPCKATEKRGCPYEGVSDHFSRPEEARAHYEATQERVVFHLAKAQLSPVKGAIVLEAYSPESDSEENFRSFQRTMEQVPDGTMLITTEGDVYEKRTIGGAYGDDSWARLNSTPRGTAARRLEKHHSYFSGNFIQDVATHGARLELPGVVFYPDVEYTSSLGRKADPKAPGLKKYSDAELAKRFAALLNEDSRLFYDLPKAPAELKDKLFEFEEEIARRRGTLSDFLTLKGYGKSSEASPNKGLSAEGIDSNRKTHR